MENEKKATPGVRLEVNGEAVPMNPFLDSLIANTVLGLASSLKGVEAVETLVLEIRRA